LADFEWKGRWRAAIEFDLAGRGRDRYPATGYWSYVRADGRE
jgi:hypothetical protein